MKTEEKTVTRSYTPFSIYSGQEQMGDPIEYTVTVKSPVITHKANLENAVMLGYNTDVTQNGGVALGAQSVASTASGVVGYDPTSGDSTDLSKAVRGKSTLAGFLTRSLAKQGYHLGYVHFPTYLIDLKNSFSEFGNDNNIEELRNVDYLVIDDLGGENVTSWSRDEVFSSCIDIS